MLLLKVLSQLPCPLFNLQNKHYFISIRQIVFSFITCLPVAINSDIEYSVFVKLFSFPQTVVQLEKIDSEMVLWRLSYLLLFSASPRAKIVLKAKSSMVNVVWYWSDKQALVHATWYTLKTNYNDAHGTSLAPK